MFRNQTMQRTIAAMVLTSFTTSTVLAPLTATAQSMQASGQGVAGGSAQTAGGNGNSNNVLLPIDPRKLPKGKGYASSNAEKAAAPTATASGSGLSAALTRLQEIATLSADSNALDATIRARDQYRSVVQQQAQADAAWAATEAHIRKAGLPASILQRHQSALIDYQAGAAALRTAMAALDDAASGKGDAKVAMQGLGAVFERYPNRPAKGKKSVTGLPWGKAKPKPHKAAMSERAHERLFPRSVQLAAAGSLSGITLPEAVLGTAPLPADLAETEDAQQTPEIRALATQLANNPVQIYAWVRNNIRYTVGYGAMQGAAATLQSGQGNAVDIASLLIAVLRAANVPARYTYGTIEVPIARAQSWLGVDNAAAVQAMLAAAGIPHQATMMAGQVSAVQLEHVWVDALVDFQPGRGAVNKTASDWVPLDASFKLTDDKAGLDLRGSVSLNEAAVFDGARLGATCSTDAAKSVNGTSLQTSYDEFKARLDTVLAQQGADLTVGGVLGRSQVNPENYSILMGTLPYKTVAVGARVNVLPEVLKWQFRFQLFAGATEQAQGQAAASLQGSFASLAGKRLTLRFAPATQADADTLASFMPRPHADGSPVALSEFPADLPAYLIRVKAELRADGQLVAEGGSFVLGSELLADIASFDPGARDWTTDTIAAHAGDYHAFVIDAQGVDAGQLAKTKARLATVQAALAAGQTSGLNRDDVSGELLHHTALAFFATVDANGAAFQRAAGVVAQRLPSYGRAVAPAMPQMMLGIVNRVSFPGIVLDIDRMSQAVATKTGGLNAAAYQRQSDERDVAYAHLSLGKVFTDLQRPGVPVSAVNALATASAQGQTIYAVTSANMVAVMPLLALSAAAKEQVQDAATAGYRVLVAQGPVSVGGWSGYAIQVEDPVNASGLYRLLDDHGNATAALYPAQGMPWLAMAEPFQAHAGFVQASEAAQAFGVALSAMLGATGSTTRWSFFPGQANVTNGLFLARLAASQGTTPCDTMAGILAANIGTASGLDQGTGTGTPVAAPFFTTVPVIAAMAGSAYRYVAAAQDPQGLALSFSLTESPGGMTIDATGSIEWKQPVSGNFAVTVRADNGKAYGEQRYMVSASSEALPLEINLAVSPAIVNVGGNVTVTMLTSGGTGAVTTALSIDGQPKTLNAAGQTTVTGSTMGVHHIVATASDSKGTTTKTSLFSVRNPADTTLPQAKISAPADDAEVTAPITVTGTASDANMAYYQLLLRPAGSGNWQEIARGSGAVTDGTLGKLDPTQLLNGIYELALNVVDINGQQNSDLITLDIYRDLKIGQFSISFEDLNVEASGIPVRVTRTYDTRRKGESLDFGHGWSVDYQSMQVRKNMDLGLQWLVTTKQLQLCLAPTGKRKINITLPTGKVERFTAANAVECQLGGVPLPDVKFTGLPGTTSKLEAENVPNILAQGGMLYDMDNLEPWNPKQFKLTTEDNYVYYLAEGVGITKIKDPSGNTLTYGQNGIVHSNGLSVAFTRDAAKRITGITDPSGKKISYAYSATGDLVSVTDRSGGAAKFSYNRSHGLIDFTDPLGVVAARYSYDSEGRLVAAYDAQGNVIETTHDTANNREVVKDRRGNVTSYTYDSAGNVTEVVNALGQKTVMTYDALGNEATVIDALGNTTTSTFDAKSGKQLTQKDALGNATSWTYDPATMLQLQSTIDAKGNLTTFGYGEFGQSINEPLGRQTSIGIDLSGNMNRMTIAGQSTRYTYDSKGNKLTETDAAGNVTTYTYDATNKEASRSWTRTVNGQAQTVSTSVKRDAEGRVIEETDALGFTSKTQYNAAGQLIGTVDAQGRHTQYSYDSRGKLVKTAYADGSSDSASYDAEGNRASTTDRQGRTTNFEYDALNRLVKTVYPNGSASSTEYDAAGRVAATIDASGNRSTSSYDAAGRLSTTTDAGGKTTQYGYDANGNRTSVTDANGKVTAFEYDALNRLFKTTYPDGKFVTVVWNNSGTKQSETDAAGNVIAFGYDAVGRLNQVTQTDAATAQVTVYGYDNLGNKTSQTDAEGRITKWTYDAANRVTSRTLPAGQTESFVYDAGGNMTSKKDFAGRVTAYGYDAAGRVNLVSRPDGASIVTSYTASGQVASVTVAGGLGIQAGKTSYQYDANDRLTRQTNPDGSYIAYGYDANGNITERSIAAGTVRYAFDANQRLQSVTDYAGKATTYTYDAAGRLATTAMPNGVTATRSYDANGRILQLMHRRADGSIVTGVRYTLAANGQRKVTEEFDGQSTMVGDVPASPARVNAYNYDSTGRLIQDKVSVRTGTVIRTTDYVYDKVGNRKQKQETTAAGTETTTYVYDSNDRLSSESKSGVTGSTVQTVYAWDANGNLRAKSIGGITTVYVWNDDNRLIEVKQGASEGAAIPIAKYAYDANGNRISKTTGDKATHFLTDSTFEYAQVLQETTDQGGVTQSLRYLWGNGLIERVGAGEGIFYHANAQGSVMAVANSTGTVVGAYVFDAYGASESNNGDTGNAYRYTGEYFDESTKLQYNRARWYDADVGRFNAMDIFRGRASFPVTLNKYLYANGEPIRGYDPSGQMTLVETGATLAVGSTLAFVAIPSFRNQLSDMASKLMSSLGAFAVSSVSAIFSQSALDNARDKLKSNVESKVGTLAAANLLFHYTDFNSAMSIMTDQCIYASTGYSHPDGAYRPSGAYATPLPPWFPNGTVSDLRALLYAKRPKAVVTNFVAIARDPAWRPVTGVEWVKPGYPGACVPVVAVVMGPNLWPSAPQQ